jgi:beta-lactam-binding protein with PASTA domain
MRQLGALLLITVAVACVPTPKRVPDVSGQTVSEARALLKQSDVGIRLEKRFSKQEAGTVLRQDPHAGYEVDAGLVVTLVIGKPLPSVPAVVGMPLDYAKQRLSEEGLRFKVMKRYSDWTPGTVLKTSPMPEAQVLPKKVVSVFIAEPIPRVPDVVGLDILTAQLDLSNYKVRVDGRASMFGYVLSQEPRAGVRLPPGRPVTLIPDPCTPGYSPCLPPALDYDCSGGTGDGPEYSGPVKVFGSDPYGLDADGDGYGCE